jgi:WD40 repeat protein
MVDAKELNMKLKISLAFLLVILLSGCAPNYTDIQALIHKKEITVPLTHAYYRDVAWLNNNSIGLQYFLQVSEPKYLTPDEELFIYDLDKSTTTAIFMPESSGKICERSWMPGIISRSDDGNLIILAECSGDPMGGPVLLMRYEVVTSELQELFDYNKQRVGLLHFTFVSENELIQESPVGHPMNNELYKVSLTDSKITTILPNFLRARWPTWSSQNKLVAFWGTAQYPGKEPEDLYTFDDIETLVRAPWDLYVMDKDGNNPKLTFPLVSNVGGLTWSPHGDWLAFGGTINDVDGIWLININDPDPIRIFDHNEIFDWSPDGKKLIVVGTKEFDAKNNDVPVKAHILELPDCVFEKNCK